MTTHRPQADDTAVSRRGGWASVFALTLCVSTLIASEFMPVSLLTPMARDLGLTEGLAGQSIAVSGVFAVITSLFIASASKGIDRRTVLLALTLLMAASGLVVTFAPNFEVLMAGRALLGVVIGGFWSMSTATVMRLVSDDQRPRALALLNGGNALATMVAAPLGSFLGQYIGWRGAFFCVVPLAAATLAWQFATLPSMPSQRISGGANVFRVLRHRQAPHGMAAVTLLFMGQFALFTYLRPFLETVTRVNVSTLSLILLIVGVSGLVGTWLIGRVLRRTLYPVLIALPLGMAVIAVGLIGFGASVILTAILLAGWGLLGTAAPVGWSTWLIKVMPDDAEAGGGLQIAAIQLAITLGAAGGGLLYDSAGHRATFAASGAILCGSALFAYLGARSARAFSLSSTASGASQGRSSEVVTG